MGIAYLIIKKLSCALLDGELGLLNDCPTAIDLTSEPIEMNIAIGKSQTQDDVVADIPLHSDVVVEMSSVDVQTINKAQNGRKRADRLIIDQYRYANGLTVR